LSGGAHEDHLDEFGLWVDGHLGGNDLAPLEAGAMIELYEGVPGSGKSYHSISEKFLP
jgi:hypothetical protein